MNKKQNKGILTRKPLYIEADADANRFNMNVLGILIIAIIICEILNEVGVFKVPPIAMRFSTIFAIVVLSIPVFTYLIHDKMLHKKHSIFKREIYKHLILTSTYIGIGMLCVTLSFHSVILIAVPPLIAAQYRNQKKLFTLVLICTLLLVIVGVYGSFFFGTTDRNFIKGMMSEEDFAIIENRFALATSSRMLDLFTHYVLPRMLGALAIILLVFGITLRNSKLLKHQEELATKVKQEMEAGAKLQSHVIDSLATLIETRDTSTGEHVIRTKRYVKIIAEKMQQKEKYKNILTREYVRNIEYAAPLHDVGKIAVSDTILLKPGKLTPEEFEAMKQHTIKGGNVIKDIFTGMENEDFLHTAEEIAMSHHEKWNGTGYPQGLKGEEIPLSARIMAVADVFDALVSVRCYKEPIPPEQALDIIISESGTHFDPDIIEVVKELHDVLVYTATLPLNKVE